MRGVVRRIPGSNAASCSGLVLPVVLVLLVVMAFAGLLAARRSATVEEISNNARVNQVAWLSAESGLRYCEAVVIDLVEGGSRFDAALKTRVESEQIQSPNDTSAIATKLVQWKDDGPALIQVPVTDDSASAALKAAPKPRCIAQAMTEKRYLITARGLSAGATLNSDGALVGGGEVWLQSVISPVVPVRSKEGGYE